MASMKIRCGDEVRRFLLPVVSFKELCQTARTLLNIEGALVFHYKDEDDDLITVTSTRDLEEGVRWSGSRCLRLSCTGAELEPLKGSNNVNQGRQLSQAEWIEIGRHVRRKAKCQASEIVSEPEEPKKPERREAVEGEKGGDENTEFRRGDEVFHLKRRKRGVIVGVIHGEVVKDYTIKFADGSEVGVLGGTFVPYQKSVEDKSQVLGQNRDQEETKENYVKQVKQAATNQDDMAVASPSSSPFTTSAPASSYFTQQQESCRISSTKTGDYSRTCCAGPVVVSVVSGSDPYASHPPVCVGPTRLSPDSTYYDAPSSYVVSY